MNQPSVKYKNRTYKLLWKGRTRYGMRAKLAYMDGSKEFWVDQEAIETIEDDHEETDWEKSIQGQWEGLDG